MVVNTLIIFLKIPVISYIEIFVLLCYTMYRAYWHCESKRYDKFPRKNLLYGVLRSVFKGLYISKKKIQQKY